MKRKALHSLKVLTLFVGLFLLHPTTSSATHFFGVDLKYEYVSGTTYTVQLICYGDCSGSAFSTFPGSNPSIQIFNGTTIYTCVTLAIQNPHTGTIVTPVCPADANLTQCQSVGYSIPGVTKFVYQNNVTINTQSKIWRFVWDGNMGTGGTGAGRSLSLTNINQTTQGNTIVGLVDTLNNTDGPNTNPLLTTLPTPFFCLNNLYYYNPGAVDPDGDSLNFALVPGKNGNESLTCGSGNLVTTDLVLYIAGTSATHPLQDVANLFAFDSTDGQLQWEPNVTQRSLVDYNIEEWRWNPTIDSQVLVGTSQREMTFLVLSCQNTPPLPNNIDSNNAGTIVDSADFKICQSVDTFNFQLHPTDAFDSPILVTYTGLPPGATITINNNSTAFPTVIFGWNATNHAVGTYTFFISFNSLSCPLESVQTVAYRVTILPVPTQAETIVTPATCTSKALFTIVPGPTGVGSPWNVNILKDGTTIQYNTGVNSLIVDSLQPDTGNYIIRVFNTSNCYSDDSLVISQPPPDTPGVTVFNPTYCGGENGSLTLSGLNPGDADTVNFRYQANATSPWIWQPQQILIVSPAGTITIPNLAAGYYDSITTKINFCFSYPVGPDTLANPPLTIISSNLTNPTHCGTCDGTITLYGLPPGEIDTINYTYQNGAQLAVRQPPIVVKIPADSTIIMSGLCAGTYDSIVVSTDYGACVSNMVYNLELDNPAVNITLGQVTNPTACGVCDGSVKVSNLAANQTDTVRYQLNGIWQPYSLFPVNQDGTVTLVNLCPGQYDSLYVTIGVSTVCVSNYVGPDTLNGGSLNPTFTYNTHHNCAGSDTVYFTNTSSAQVSLTRWHFGDGTMDSITNPVHIYDTAGTYSVTMYVSNQTCTDSITEIIDTHHPLQPAFTLSPADTVCQGQIVTFANTSIGGNPTYVWNLGDGTIDKTDVTPPTHVYNNAGVYQVSLIEEDTLACIDTFVQALYVDSNAAASIMASDSSICAGKQIIFTAVYTRIGSHGISWSFGDGFTAGNINPVTHVYGNSVDSAVITLNALYRACPDTTAKKTVYIRPYPLLNLGPDTSLCPGSTPIALADYINAATPGAKWIWNTGDTTSGIEVSVPGLYYTTVSVGGCDNSDSVMVNKDCYIDIPNAFTPNNDGVNDYFFPRNLLTSGVTSFKMEVYNRWGQQIFETNNTDGLGWDGKFNNVPQPEGVYVYIIDVTFKNDKKEHHQGNVTLLK